MNLEQRVREVLILLLQMSEDPIEVVQVLDEAVRSSFIKELGVLGKQAAAIQSGADLSNLIDAIHRLVEDRPALVSLLLPEGNDATQQSPLRSVSMADHLATVEPNAYAQARAPQIHNAIIECRTQLEAALQEASEPKHKPGQEKKP
jgi:hypothetical protein